MYNVHCTCTINLYNPDPHTKCVSFPVPRNDTPALKAAVKFALDPRFMDFRGRILGPTISRPSWPPRRRSRPGPRGARRRSLGSVRPTLTLPLPPATFNIMTPWQYVRVVGERRHRTNTNGCQLPLKYQTAMTTLRPLDPLYLCSRGCAVCTTIKIVITKARNLSAPPRTL